MVSEYEEILSTNNNSQYESPVSDRKNFNFLSKYDRV